MKKLSAALMAATATLAMSAEGYQVNTFSAKQEGMGHVGVAMKLGSESMIFNPGALAFTDKQFEISGSLSAIMPTATATVNGTNYETDNKVSTPFNVSAAFRIYDNLAAGVTVYTPYGSSINWGKNWPGSVLNQSVDLKVFTVQPTISWRIIPKLSVGAGLMISWGSVDLNKGLVATSSYNSLVSLMAMKGMQVETIDPTISPASAHLVGESKVSLGFNVGAMYDINEHFSVGASFRSKMKMQVKKGDVTVNYANEKVPAVLGSSLDNLSYTNFAAEMPCPYVLSIGVSYRPIKRLTLAFDAQLNGWSTYKQLNIEFEGQSQFDQHLTKNYHNAMTYHLGGQFEMTKRLDLRAGLMVDTSPCDQNYYNPETPATTKIEPSVGLSFRPVKGLSIDLAFMYIHGVKVNNARGEYSDFIASSYNAALDAAGIPESMMSRLATTGEFHADYKVKALVPAIGVSYSF